MGALPTGQALEELVDRVPSDFVESRDPLAPATSKLPTQTLADPLGPNSEPAPSPPITRGVTQYSIEELCDEIRSSTELSQCVIEDLYRREVPNGVRHEYIVIRCAARSGHTPTWIRIDRSAKGGLRFDSSATKLAQDTVCMHLINVFQTLVSDPDDYLR